MHLAHCVLKERAPVKFALSVSARLEGETHAHARKALAAGVTKNELSHIALLAMQTIGYLLRWQR